MTRPPFEVADIVRRHGDRFLETHRAWVTAAHRRVLRAIAQCRTAALGGHRDRCEQCAQPALSYNSCRDRHCPRCLTAARNAWVAAREAELLPVGYVHIVFTMPEPLARLALANKRVIYDLLFRAAAETLLRVAANPKRLGAAIGGLMVLHTWGQRLQHHPHVHCVVPMGGLAPDRVRWIHARPRFFLPIPVLRKVFRGKLVAGLREAHRDGRLDFPGTLAPLKPDAAFRTFVRSLYRQAWVVYAKPPFGSPSHVLHYLARYTHRVAISNHRLVDVTDDTVSFRWKDYRHGSQRADAHTRGGGIPSALPAARLAEALRAHPLLRLPRLALSHGAAPTVSARLGRRDRSTASVPATGTAEIVAVSPLRCAHARHRAPDAAADLSHVAPRRHPP